MVMMALKVYFVAGMEEALGAGPQQYTHTQKYGMDLQFQPQRRQRQDD